MPTFNFPKFPTLTTDRLLLDVLSINDAQDLYEIRTNSDVLEFMDSAPHADLEESKIFIQASIGQYAAGTGISWAIKMKGEEDVIGYFSYWRMDHKNQRGEIGYALKPSHWGKGIMTEVFNAVIPFGFHQLGLHSIEANINEANARSQAVLEKIGFQKEAHFRENYFFNGKFIDSIIYSLLESDLKK